ncbi:MAG TPA: carboxypeptidase regulatory-like domain-containing protein [Candidatus Brocadiia bacterium]|nr:carboxypeptidase regulatory-like domain-containing protein [Planctomycetota bacterium]MBI4007645.1 carboxypeptidase regulatory-like domain-containing protein [Planctomycetota bacterium]MDO8094568.1 carboxypeptidase regulatory-like domain-containing protein [Candidatus Brocadiales bacterium]
MRNGIFSLTGVLSLILGANLAMAGGTITGTVNCKGIKNPRDTIVYIEKLDGNFAPQETHAVMDQQNLVFIPHVLPIVVGTSVDFPNSDTVRHNVFSPAGSAKVFNLGTYDVGVIKTVVFDSIGEAPLLCNVHAEMSSFVVTLQNPYFAITDKAGAFTIKDAPPGKYTLTTWHERLKSASQGIEVKDGDTVTVDFKLKERR